MGSFLDTMAGAIYAGFKGKLRSGIIVRNLSGTLDSHGRPSDSVPIATKIEGFEEAYSEFFRAQAGIPATDLKVNIFGASMKDSRPRKDDRVRLDYPAANGNPARSVWYQLRAATTDPAAALWTCRSFIIAAGPTEFVLNSSLVFAELSELVNEELPGEDQ